MGGLLPGAKGCQDQNDCMVGTVITKEKTELPLFTDYLPKNLRKLPESLFELILSYVVGCNLNIPKSVLFKYSINT